MELENVSFYIRLEQSIHIDNYYMYNIIIDGGT